jgi:hypothetical protein
MFEQDASGNSTCPRTLMDDGGVMIKVMVSQGSTDVDERHMFLVIILQQL